MPVACFGSRSHLMSDRPIYGYKGKQVRDNIHVLEGASFIAAFAATTRRVEGYNLGGGCTTSCSILEAFDMVEQLTGKKMRNEYLEKNRAGDHICYISDLTKIPTHYPEWKISVSLRQILDDIVEGWRSRAQ